METQLTQPVRPFQGHMPGQGMPQMMMGMRPGVAPMINPYNVLPEQEEKRR